MRARTLTAVVAVLLAAAGLAVAGVSLDRGSGVDVGPEWVSDTARAVGGNHHAPAAGTVAGRPMVYAPVSGRAGTGECALVALDGTNGSERWTAPIPAADCTIHSVADPTLADFDGDGAREVLAATTERRVAAHHPLTGAVEFRHELGSYGYTKPVVADLLGTGTPETVVVDVRGTVSVLHPNGTAAWTTRLGAFTWGQPAVADVDADGAPEVAVGLGGSGGLRVLEANGTTAWARPDAVGSSVTWMTTGQADADPATEIVVATARGGAVVAVDGASGEREWARDFGAYAAVHAFGDGDGDGAPEVYAVARDGVLRSLDARTGATEWTTALTSADAQMTPPPALGDVDGDGDPDLVAVTNGGLVSVVDPDSGAVRGTYERDGEAAIYTHPTLADLDGDGDAEVLVTYGDGRVVALDVA